MKYLPLVASLLCCSLAALFGVKANEHPIGFALVFISGILMGAYFWGVK